MKKNFLLIFLCVFSFNTLISQQEIAETTALASLGKMYGFLKYYHPKVSQGKYQWDQELLKQLPEVLKSQDKESLSQVYLDWIERLGAIKTCKKCNSKEDSFDKNFDLSWTQDTTIFTNSLAEKLIFIKNNRNQQDNYYLAVEPDGAVIPKNEPIYDNVDLPSEEYRLLGLFKYWNHIEYFYPYKYLTDQSWDSVLMEMIPKIRAVSTVTQYQNTLRELVGKLDDSHAWISFQNTSQYKSLPIKVSHVEGKAVVSEYYNDSIAQLNNLKLGDVILQIDGQNIENILTKKLKYVSGSNSNFKIKKAYREIFNGMKDTVELVIDRDGKTQKIKVKRYDFRNFDYLKNKCAVKTKSLDQTTGYIDMGCSFTPKDFEKIFKSFESKKTIIVDLRAYPELRWKMFTRYFNTENRIFALKYVADIHYPGRFKFVKSFKTNSSRKAFKGNFILLVNEDSFSLSEFTAMAFQTADKVMTIGNTTAGSDGRNIITNYLGGYKTAFTSHGIMYPDKQESQRKGVKIDLEVKPTINGLKNGRDEVLEKAVQVANE